MVYRQLLPTILITKYTYVVKWMYGSVKSFFCAFLQLYILLDCVGDSWWIMPFKLILLVMIVEIVRCICVPHQINPYHDDVIKWKHFPRKWPFVRGIHRSPVNSPHKGQWRGALMFPLICVWITYWENSREADDLRRWCAHYDVTIMPSLNLEYFVSMWWQEQSWFLTEWI